MIKYLVLPILLLCVFSPAASKPNQNNHIEHSWAFINPSEIPSYKSNHSDAFLTKAIRLNRGSDYSPIYMIMEGWENGWHYYYLKNEIWKEIGSKTQVMSSEFSFGHFDEDNIPDLLLYLALEEENFTGNAMPVIPKFFSGTHSGFKQRPISCIPVLHKYFLGKLEFYKTSNADSANQSTVEFYSDEFNKKCD